MKNLCSKRLNLLVATPQIMEAAISGRRELAQLLQVNVLDGYSEYGVPVLSFVLNKYKEDESQIAWWTYLVLHLERNEIIGTCGYKGAPGESGEVEIGYEIGLPYRGQGLATEAANALFEHAINDPKVRFVSAKTLAEPNASTRVLEKCGFEKTATFHDPHEGFRIWYWQRWQ